MLNQLSSSEFARFVETCQAFPTSDAVRSRREFLPTFLIATNGGDLIYGELELDSTVESRLVAMIDLAKTLETADAWAFAVLTALDVDGAPRLREFSEIPFARYREAILIQAFELSGEHCCIVGLFDTLAGGIASWHDFPTSGGLLVRLLDALAADWRELTAAA